MLFQFLLYDTMLKVHINKVTLKILQSFVTSTFILNNKHIKGI